MNLTMIPKPPALSDVKVIDADTHIAEPYDLWTSRAPAKYKERVPQVKIVDGEAIWVIDGDKKMGPAFPVSAIRRDGSKGSGIELTKYKFEDAFEGAHDVKARLDYMDSVGIAAQIAYPNLLGFGNQKSMGVDRQLRFVTTQIYNDAMAEFQAASGNRIFPQALLPWWNIEQSVAEAERCHTMGMRGINTNPDPQNHGQPVISEAHWNPLWELCSDLDMPVNFHIGGGFEKSDWFGVGGWNTTDPGAWMAFGSSMLFFANYRTFANLFLSRMLERFPKLKVVSVESGVGWIPFMLESIEYFMQEEKIKYEISPFELFQRQIFACSWFERRRIVENARYLGIDHVLFQTDFPHPVCLYPDPMNYMAEAADRFTPEERKKVFGENAARVYNIPLNELNSSFERQKGFGISAA